MYLSVLATSLFLPSLCISRFFFFFFFLHRGFRSVQSLSLPLPLPTQPPTHASLCPAPPCPNDVPNLTYTYTYILKIPTVPTYTVHM